MRGGQGKRQDPKALMATEGKGREQREKGERREREGGRDVEADTEALQIRQLKDDNACRML
jgi:hypothetical protein